MQKEWTANPDATAFITHSRVSSALNTRTILSPDDELELVNHSGSFPGWNKPLVLENTKGDKILLFGDGSSSSPFQIRVFSNGFSLSEKTLTDDLLKRNKSIISEYVRGRQETIHFVSNGEEFSIEPDEYNNVEA